MQFMVAMLAYALNQRMDRKAEYLREENRVLNDALLAATGKSRIPLTHEQRRRLATKGKRLGGLLNFYHQVRGRVTWCDGYLDSTGARARPRTPRNVIKVAFSARILSDGQVWIDMLNHRNLLSHKYDESVFEEAVVAIRDRYLPAFEDLHSWLLARRATG